MKITKLPRALKGKWNKRWAVTSESDPTKDHIVALSNDESEWGCSCPVWKFRRMECKHIIAVKEYEKTIIKPVIDFDKWLKR